MNEYYTLIAEYSTQAYSDAYYYIDIIWQDTVIQTHTFPRTSKGLIAATQFKQDCRTGTLKQGNPNYGELEFFGPYTVTITKNEHKDSND